MGNGGTKVKRSRSLSNGAQTPILIQNLPSYVTEDMLKQMFPTCTRVKFLYPQRKKAHVYFSSTEKATIAYHRSTLYKTDLFRLSWPSSASPRRLTPNKPSISGVSNNNQKDTGSNSSSDSEDAVFIRQEEGAYESSTYLSKLSTSPGVPTPGNLSSGGSLINAKKISVSPEQETEKESWKHLTTKSQSCESSATYDTVDPSVRKEHRSEPKVIKQTMALESLIFSPNRIVITNLPKETDKVVSSLKRVVILYTKQVDVSPDADCITVEFKRVDDCNEMAKDFRRVKLKQIQKNQFSWNDSEHIALHILDPFQRFGDFGSVADHDLGTYMVSFQLEIKVRPDTTTKEVLAEDFPSAYFVQIKPSSSEDLITLKFGPLGFTEWNYNRAKIVFKNEPALIRFVKLHKYPPPVEIFNLPLITIEENLKAEFPAATSFEMTTSKLTRKRHVKTVRLEFATTQESNEGFRHAIRRIPQMYPGAKVIRAEKKIVERVIIAEFRTRA